MSTQRINALDIELPNLLAHGFLWQSAEASGLLLRIILLNA